MGRLKAAPSNANGSLGTGFSRPTDNLPKLSRKLLTTLPVAGPRIRLQLRESPGRSEDSDGPRVQRHPQFIPRDWQAHRCPFTRAGGVRRNRRVRAVSYTHLTLPTSDLV